MGSFISKLRRSAAVNGKERKERSAVSNGYTAADDDSSQALATAMPGLRIR